MNLSTQLGFIRKQLLDGSPDKNCRRIPTKTVRCMTQTELTERWRIIEAQFGRWRTESAGQPFVKLGNRVHYQVQDVEAFE